MAIVSDRKSEKRDPNKIREDDKPVHEWYRFVLSYPPHLVREYLQRFGIDRTCVVLDPFCGTGTTLVECKKLGIPSIGIEANPMAVFASATKTNWAPDPDKIRKQRASVGEEAEQVLQEYLEDESFLLHRQHPHKQQRAEQPFRTLPNEMSSLLLTDSISPLPLHKTLVLLEEIKKSSTRNVRSHLMLALAHAVVFKISNLRFGPEVGLGQVKKNAEVVRPWLEIVEKMANDLERFQGSAVVSSQVRSGDARCISSYLQPESIEAVITSPPYPNEKDYSRTTRLESVLLGLISSKEQLRAMKQTLVRSNTRSVYQSDKDDQYVAQNSKIQQIAEEIEARRIALGKTSGFERLYARVTKLYFGGMYRHLAELRTALRPGAKLAYVVGDQASYLRVMIQTGHLLAEIADSLGYEVIGIDLFRTRLATATKHQLREEVVLLRWPGRSRSKKGACHGQNNK